MKNTIYHPNKGYVITRRKTSAFYHRTSKLFLLTILFFTFCMPLQAAIIYVNIDAAGGAEDGTSWADAFLDLQEAIDDASAGDEIWVAAGTYLPTKDAIGNANPSNNRHKTFYIDFDIKIYGGFPNTGNPTMADRDWETNSTTLSGDFEGDDEPNFVNVGENAYTIVHTKNVSAAFLMDGFFVEGGNASASSGLGPNRIGGGWYNDGSGSGKVSNPSIRFCSFQNNQAYFGGALFNIGGSSGTSSPTLTNCSFLNNQADDDGGAIYSYGDGGTTKPIFVNCIFTDNTADDRGGVLGYDDADAGRPQFINCSFYGNTAAEGGVVGIVFWDSGEIPPLLKNCIAWGNSATFGDKGELDIQYSLIQEGNCPPGANCGAGMIFNQDPLFTDPANGDLTLVQCSPVINKGQNAANSETEDLAGNTRIVNTTIDLGAYEFQGNISSNTIYVNEIAGGTNTGQSWTDAFIHLQDAIDVAKKCSGITEIWVAAGTYLPTKDAIGDANPTNNRDKTFYINFDIKIYGGFPNTGNPTMADRDWETNSTTLSGDFDGDDGANFANTGENAYTVVHTKNVSTAFLMDGFFVEGGNANASSGFGPSRIGGGWYNDGSGSGKVSNPSIRFCSFLNNQADIRGGAFYNDGSNGTSSPTLTNCSFQNNQANRGGALYNDGQNGTSSPSLINCSFQDNQANDDGGALFNQGFLGTSSPNLTNCSFQNNEATIYGGALYNNGGNGASSPNLANCSFQNNQANEDGGALFNDGSNGTSSPTLTNCTFQNNQANEQGGALFNKGRFSGTSSPTLTNCIFWQNIGNGKSMFNDDATPQINYTLLEEDDCPSGATCGAGMIFNQDPLFTDPINGDLTLQDCSPAIDAGTTASGEPFDDMGAFEFQGTPICCTSFNDIVYVNETAGGTNSGQSWTDAFIHLQDAIDVAKECGTVTEIWVAAGTYLPTKTSSGNATPSNNRNKTFYIDFDIEVYGGFPNTGNPTMADRNWETYITTLSGDLDNNDGANFANTGQNAYTVVHTKNVSTAFLMDGFFVEGGNASVSSGFSFNPKSSGGGWYNDGSGSGNVSNPSIQFCSFQNNQSSYGGALFNGGSHGGMSSPSLTNCSFHNNQADGHGGALFNDGSYGGTSSPSLTNCSFQENQADGHGGALYNEGDSSGTSSPSLTNCSFHNNQADLGGALFNDGSYGGMSSPSLTNCSFHNNQSSYGGALYNYGKNGISSPSLTNCSFHNNQADTGGALHSNGKDGISSPTLTNCSFHNNQADLFGDALFNNHGANPTLTNCIFWQNESMAGSNSQINYSLLQENTCPTGATCGAGMIFNQDPLFTDPANGDLTLQECSPAIDAGTIASGEPFDDMGAFEFQGTPGAAPEAICKNITIDLDNSGNVSIDENDVDDNSTHYCGLKSKTIDQSAFDCSHIGTPQNVTLTIVDNRNLSSDCTAVITVTDNEKPVISGCPDDISKNADAGECDTEVTWTPPTASDNCTDPQTVTQTMGGASGSVFPVGETTIQYSATDAATNVSDVCSFTITVSDGEKPVISGCPDNISKDTDTGECTSVVTWTAPTATDNCTSPQVVVRTMGDASGSTFPLGETTIQYSATDAATNVSDVCSFTITVTDGEKPVISGCPDNISKNADAGVCNAVVTWTAPTATDNCTSPQAVVRTMGDASGSTFPLGETTIKYTATDAVSNVSDECSFTITVSDNEKPVISGCPDNISKDTDAGECTAVVTWTAPTATDNCTSPQSISQTLGASSGSTFSIGTATISYAATDDATNEAVCSFTVTVTDNEKPAISGCPNNVSQNTDSGECDAIVSWTAPTATDNCTSPQEVSQTMGAASGTAFAVGMTTIKYTATDDAENTEECSFTVTITDNEKPIAVCQNIDVQLDEDGMATVTAADIDNGSNDACGIASVDGTTMTFDCDDLEAAYEMTITVTDIHDNTDECTANITVLDEDNPCCPNTHILYVDASTPNDFNGDDWNNAVASFEEALEFAAKCENVTEIWVADGTYYPTTGTDRTAAFAMMNGIAIYGGFKGTETMLSERDWTLYPTILSGDIGTPGDDSDNSYHVFFHDDNGLDATAILDGFVIKNGNADNIGVNEVGAGMFNRHVSPSVSNCVFENNTASFGGGAMYHFGGNTHIEDCTFNNNSALIGGAVFNSDDAGAAYYMCHFNNNSATDHGGGMFNNIASVPYVENCTFDGNSAMNYGGGLYNITSSPDVMNCLFINNTADEGAAVANQGDAADANFVNCTFSANDAGPLGGIARNFGNTSPSYTNCIFWGNASNTTGTVITDSPPGATVTYSIVEGGYPGTGNKDTNPMFVSSTDFHLEPCSPAIGSGNSSSNFVSTDMDDATRILGNIDLGVYELPTSTGTPITWTGNGDGENWSDAANWDLGIVPQKCNDVLIPAPHVVKVQGNIEGLGRTIEVELGADLVTDPTGMTNIGN